MILHEKELLDYLAGQEMEFRCTSKNSNNWQWQDFVHNKNSMDIFNRDIFEVRVKPKVITVSFEMPKTFTPKHGELYFYLADAVSCGYRHAWFTSSTCLSEVSRGVWNTEEKVKQVVEALNSFRKQGLK